MAGLVAHKHAPFFARHMSGSELTGTKTLEQFKDSFVRTPVVPLRCDYSCVCAHTEIMSSQRNKARLQRDAYDLPCLNIHFLTVSFITWQAGKCMATVRYSYMAQQADVEGYVDVSSSPDTSLALSLCLYLYLSIYLSRSLARSLSATRHRCACRLQCTELVTVMT
jgi:hypothetical protein